MDHATTRLAVAAGLDTAIVVAFVAIGRNNHDEDPGVAGLISTVAPFLIGLAVGWLVARAWDRDRSDPSDPWPAPC